ncbi:F-box/LRR-repeat protein 3 [Cucumis melo var. makuwa]|uniref:F-box/LRR-repeat protein 3 n=1 Tax=Cucumis melo var. makuwa TaxID=1194695 RepID=A0A5D3CFY7_CUCMM|nr:F-box/LRR-repeat protein 3 [Cucumis melo var. makuwa]TYK10270.1 F-box/LRR-repeat protein 3 [Cucumis melo var. makuwa]
MPSPFPLFLNFPDEILIRVRQNLTHHSDSKSWRLVCKDFHRVDLISRKTLRVRRIEFLLSLITKFENIDELDLSICSRINDGTVSIFLGFASSSLRRLILRRSAGLSYMGLEKVTSRCTGLEMVDMSYSWRFGDREAAAVSICEGLKEVRLDKCLGVTDVGLARIVVGCGRLEKLSLKWCLQVTNESLRSISSLPKLETLVMAGCLSVDDAGLQYLEHGCPFLKELDISRCDAISSYGLTSILRGHDGLEQLDASYCFSELSTDSIYRLKNLKCLKAIRLDGTQLSSTFFNVISDHCEYLVELGLSKCLGVTDANIIQLISRCISLKVLNLTCCHSITDAAISKTATSCQKLMSLKLESCNMITERSLDQLALNCPLLEELDLTDCCGVNDKGLECLSRCSQLLSLKLGLCTNITDKGLIKIGLNCKRIHELDLYRCLGIGDAGLEALSSGCKKLMKLNLSYCNKLTDRGMGYIGLLEELCVLEIRGLHNVTGVGLTAVAAGCKRLVDLDMKQCQNVDDSGFWALASYAHNLRQLNVSSCAVSDVGLCMMMGNLTCLQDVKLVNLNKVSVRGFDLALRTCCLRIKKVKLHASLRFTLSSEILEILNAWGCKIRWD